MSSDGESDHDSSDGESGGGGEVGDMLPATIEGLSSGGDPSTKISYLVAFCDALAFVEYAEDLNSLPLDGIVPLLVKLVGREEAGSPDVMLLSARALTYFLDLVPRSTKVLVKYGAVEALCGPLREIEYLDLAEQCLEALEKLSRRESEACLKAGLTMTVLGFVNFFEIRTQRVALSTVSNVCKIVPEDCLSTVMDAIPALCNFLGSPDKKIVESAAICLMRIVENSSHSSEHLDKLCEHGVVRETLKLISSSGQMMLSETIYIGIIELLVRLATLSIVAVRVLYELNIISILGSILTSYDMSSSTASSRCEDISSDKLYVVLKLLNQLFPPKACDEQNTQLVLNKQKIILEGPKISLQFTTEILPSLIQAVDSGVNKSICYGCVYVVNNYLSVVTPDMLRELMENSNIPKFLSSLFSRKDHHVLIPALNIVEIIMSKLPDEYLRSFVKEGISHAIKQLSMQEDCCQQLMDVQSCQVVDIDDRKATHVSKCLCYEFGNCSYTSSSEAQTCRLQRHSLTPLAQHIMSTFFSESLIFNMVSSENIQRLKARCLSLVNNADFASTSCAEEKEYLSEVLDEFIKVLNEEESMSTYEFIDSGFVRFLAHYLTVGNYNSRCPDGDNRSGTYLTGLKRLQKVTFVLLSSQKHFPVASLVQHLQKALSTLECFPVIRSSAYKPVSRRTDIPAKRSTTHPCLRVQFVEEQGDTSSCGYDNILTVELSSTLDSIEGFLWPKIKKKTAGNKRSRTSQHHRKQSSQKEGPKGQVESSKRNESNTEDNRRPKLTFYFEGKRLDRSQTLYQAILQGKTNEDPDINVSTKFWSEVHIVTFRRELDLHLTSPHIPVDTSFCCDKIGMSFENSYFPSMLLPGLPCKLEMSNPSDDTLFLLKTLEWLSRVSFQFCSNERINKFAEGKLKNFDDLKVIAPSLHQNEFINSKLNAKLEQQMHDPLALSTATMPLWCTQLVTTFSFLFTFEARWKYFCLDTFGISRNQMQNSEKNDVSTINDRRSSSSSLPRKKFKVHRNNILGSAVKMMNWYASRNVILEIEFSKEVGSGLGPTLEFYTVLSHELQKVGMGMWRGDLASSTTKLKSRKGTTLGDSDLIGIHSGLFPRPWSSCTDSSNCVIFSKVLKNFFLLGQLIARAIRDGRILDLTLSRAFYRLILEQDLDIYDIQSFDSELGRTLIEFLALAKRKCFLESSSGDHLHDTLNLSFRNTRIEDLCLDFTLPGYPDYVFALRSVSEMVNISNLEEYVSLVVDATLRSGISRQLESFKSGFNKVFPIRSLQIFTAEELEKILCGELDTWDFNELQDHINFDHGYSSASPPAIQFLEIIHEFEAGHRRAFLLFVTGTPRLPPGGLAALKPKLTVVRKHCDKDIDTELPSVMTCANYLKLPPYSSKELMREKLLYAISEGQGSFHLS